MKVVVIGGASSYTPELVDGLLARPDRLTVSEIVLMDVRADRLATVTDFCRRMAAKRGSRTRIESTTHLHESLDGARFVIAQIRVGGMAARIADEKLGRRHGIIGQETTGVGGFACALRTIPRVLDVARAMEDACPGALLLNFANPSGIVTEAVIRQAPVPVIAVHQSTRVDAPMQVIAGERLTPAGRAAVAYAGVLADADDARYVEILNRDDMVQTARKERVDLIALGFGDEHDQQVVQHSNCAVLTVNRFAS